MEQDREKGVEEDEKKLEQKKDNGQKKVRGWSRIRRKEKRR